MKKSIYSWPLALAAVLMVGCSNDDGILDGDNDPGKETTTSYLSVNLVSADTSRADAGYENGTDAENKVSSVRFYFFTGTGAAANVKLRNGAYVNYYDWTPGATDQTTGTNGNNVESKLKATLVIETPKGDKLPTQIAAVINPVETEQSRSLTTLKGITKDYASSALTTSGKFVMFNSVYGNSAKTAEICTVPIKEENLTTTSAAAIANPVTIYVERSVAKVSVTLASSLNIDATTNLIKLKTKVENGEDLKVEGDQVYLKINGWKLAAETSTGNLVKAINYNSWNSSDIGSWWNNYSNRRSCWAVNASDAENEYWSYNDITPADPSKYDFSAPLYTNENADNYSDHTLNSTKVIISGTLCKEDGTPFTIVRHLGAHFADTYSTTEDLNLPQLKKNILAQLTSDTQYYWKDGETYKAIAEADLQIVAVESDEAEDETANDCYVYAQLNATAAARTWYTTNTDGATAIENGPSVINTNLKNNVDKALVWNTGMTYYYYEILHHTDDKGTKIYGVVRNHVYKTTVTGIAGLGTPVYKPDQKIYPEKPDNNDHFIAAQINILAWHIVDNDYVLEW